MSIPDPPKRGWTVEGNKAFCNDGELGKIMQVKKFGQPAEQIGWSWSINAQVSMCADGSLDIEAENDQDYAGCSCTSVAASAWVLDELLKDFREGK